MVAAALVVTLVVAAVLVATTLLAAADLVVRTTTLVATVATAMVATSVVPADLVVAVAKAEVLGVGVCVSRSSSNSRRTMVTEALVQSRGRKRIKHVSTVVKWGIGWHSVITRQSTRWRWQMVQPSNNSLLILYRY